MLAKNYQNAKRNRPVSTMERAMRIVALHRLIAVCRTSDQLDNSLRHAAQGLTPLKPEELVYIHVLFNDYIERKRVVANLPKRRMPKNGIISIPVITQHGIRIAKKAALDATGERI